MKTGGAKTVRCFTIAAILMFSSLQTTLACNNSPVFAFSQAVYLKQYDRAGGLLQRVVQERGPQLARFLEYVLAWKQAFDLDDRAGQKAARQDIDHLIEKLTAAAQQNPSIENQLLAGNIMIHAARIHLVAAEVFQASTLAKQGNKFIQSVLDQTPQNVDAYLAAGLYQYYAGSEEPIFGWFKKIYSLKGDPRRGRELIELAAQLSPDYAFEAARSLIMDLSWDRPEVCAYRSLIYSQGGQLEIAIDAQLNMISLLLYCGEAKPANQKIAELNKKISEGALQITQAQKQWISEAGLYGLAQTGSVKELKSRVFEAQQFADKNQLAYTQFSLAKAYDIAGLRPDALRLYKKIAQSSVRRAYKHLAEKYTKVPYSLVKSLPDVRVFEMACSE